MRRFASLLVIVWLPVSALAKRLDIVSRWTFALGLTSIRLGYAG